MTDPQTIVVTVVTAAAAGWVLTALLLLVRRRLASPVMRVSVWLAWYFVAGTSWFTDYLLLRLNTTT